MSSTSKSKSVLRDKSGNSSDRRILGEIEKNLQYLETLEAEGKQGEPQYKWKKKQTLGLFKRMSSEYKLNKDIAFIYGVMRSKRGEPLSFIDYDMLKKVIFEMRVYYARGEKKYKPKTKKKKKKSSRKKKKQSTKRR